MHDPGITGTGVWVSGRAGVCVGRLSSSEDQRSIFSSHVRTHNIIA